MYSNPLQTFFPISNTQILTVNSTKFVTASCWNKIEICFSHFSFFSGNAMEPVKEKKQRFPCYYCDKRFSKIKLLQEHRLNHVVGMGQFPCRYCKIRELSYKDIESYGKKSL